MIRGNFSSQLKLHLIAKLCITRLRRIIALKIAVR